MKAFWQRDADSLIHSIPPFTHLFADSLNSLNSLN